MPERPRALTATDPSALRPGDTRRVRRTAALLVSVMLVVCAASLFVYESGVGVLEERAAAELAHVLRECHGSVEDEIEGQVTLLELVANGEQMVSIFDGDLDHQILRALQNALARSSFTRLACLDAAGEVIASTGHEDFERVFEVPPEVRHSLSDSQRVHLALEGGRLVMLAPVHFEFDERELIGFVRAEGRLEELLEGARVPIARLVSQGGDVLATRRAPRRAGAPAPRWGDAALRIETVPLAVPPGVPDPGWTLAIASDGSRVVVEAALLRRTALLLTACTAGLVVLLVLAFARAEGRLSRRLAGRTVELEEANESLDRSRSDLVKAARIAGMSEVATGILHNVGNALNSLVVAAQQAEASVAGSRVADLRQMVDFLGADRDGFTSAVREHPKGEPFLDYLGRLTANLEADRDHAAQELGSVRSSIDHVTTLVQAQQEFATRTSVTERAELAQLMEGALVLGVQALGDPGAIAVVREYDALPEALVDKHRVIEVLVNLIHNARQALDEARTAQPRLSLRVLEAGVGRVRYEVEDNGVGIAPADLTRIFHHGFSTRADGHGWGLHAASNAATELGGTLSAESAGPGTGARFTLELPYAAVVEPESPLARAS